MKPHKIIISIGSTIGGVALLVLSYNFIDMYSLVEKCRDVINTQQCRAYTEWIALNKIGLAVLVIGIAILVFGLWKRHQNKTS